MKSRYWSFIVYPESVKEGWINELEEKGLVFAISPLHDKDVNPTGEKKKEHYHILVEYEGPKTYKSIKEEICDKIGATIPKKIESLRGYYRHSEALDAVILLKYLNPGQDYFIDVVEKKFSNTIF